MFREFFVDLMLVSNFKVEIEKSNFWVSYGIQNKKATHHIDMSL